MEKIIHKYLDNRFEIKLSTAFNDGIYLKYEGNATPFMGYNLIEDLSIIFNVNKKELKLIIDTWSITKKNDTDLEFYWCHNFGSRIQGILPIVSRVMSSTIASDLISVKPLQKPTNIIYYFDYIKKPIYIVIFEKYGDICITFTKNLLKK